MTYLKFYADEQREFKESYSIKIAQSDAVKIVNKLVRHYKLPKLNVVFRKTSKGGGSYCPRRYTQTYVSFHRSVISIGIIIHEVAHHYRKIKVGNSKHTKKLMSVIRRMTKYSAKMNYWGFLKGSPGDMD